MGIMELFSDPQYRSSFRKQCWLASQIERRNEIVLCSLAFRE